MPDGYQQQYHPSPRPAGAWNLTADLTNRAPGPWDAQRLPLAGLQAQARYAAGGWTVNQATATVGSAPARAAWTCKAALRPPPGQCKARSACATCRPPPCTLRWRRRPCRAACRPKCRRRPAH